MTAPVLGIASLLVTAILCGVVRRHASATALLDKPNERSSHTVPTPRGGGAAVAAALVGSATVLWLQRSLQLEVFVALLGVIPVAVVGWRDDRQGVPVRVRITVHAMSAVWAVAWLGGFPSVMVGTDVHTLGIVGALLAVLAVVWSINLFNFMDGIDGISGVEAATTSIAAAVMLNAVGATGLGALSVATAGAAIGFLIWNWPPAKLFMGDVGSGALGFWFAVLALASDQARAVPAIVWALLGSMFLVDATATLVRRVVAGERWHEAHRSHAYQRLARTSLGHRGVTASVLLLNTALGILAWFSLQKPSAQSVVVATVFAALTVLYVAIVRRFPVDAQPGASRT
ncbi:MAG TPA: glycosyltransferase family 4 protein [Gemmatimonadaceae bacterium]|nr:glycosyltransferase family 4 protein [Gemmatimonadaceae bacterium]